MHSVTGVLSDESRKHASRAGLRGCLPWMICPARDAPANWRAPAFLPLSFGFAAETGVCRVADEQSRTNSWSKKTRERGIDPCRARFIASKSQVLLV